MATKAKTSYQNTNIAMIGSDADLHARLVKAGKEPAWATAGKAAGLEIWRIEKFKVVPWPKDQYGVFFDGDSYIILNTYKKGADAFGWDIHFWLGMDTSQDEAGTAAYKAVELDDHFGGIPVQYREVMGFESSRFLSYFHGKVTTIPGGIATGFHHVGLPEAKPILYWIKGGRRHIRVKDVPCSKESMNSGDVFILATSNTIIQWNGATASPVEKSKAVAICRTLQNAHTGHVKVLCIEEGDKNEDFWKYLGGFGAIKSARDGGADAEAEKEELKTVLYKLSDASGKLTFSKMGEGKLDRKLLGADDVYVVDVGTEVYAWIGRGASAQERRNAMKYAHTYLTEHNRPPQMAVITVRDGDEPEHFWSAFEF